MVFAKDDKEKIVTKYQHHTTDTGSPEVLVGKRRRLLKYLKDKDIAKYRKILESLNLRK
jgi:small subunit ribosomal protein S15